MDSRQFNLTVIETIARYLFEPTPKISSLIEAFPAAKQALKDCHKITWLEVWRGRIPFSLIEYASVGRYHKKCGRHIVRAIYNAFLLIWRQRNDTLHDRTLECPPETKAILDRLTAVTDGFCDLPYTFPRIRHPPDPSVSSDHIIACFLAWAEPLLRSYQLSSLSGPHAQTPDLSSLADVVMINVTRAGRSSSDEVT